MANVSPGIYTKIKDLSTFVQVIPGTIGFLCALTEKGEDNKIRYLSGRDELIDEFGEPNISLYGVNYSQGPYVAYNYLGESGAFYFMRCLPDDATYANLRIDGLDYDSSTDIELSYVSDINNNTTDITTAIQSVGIRNPLVIFYPIGRGSYYNNYGIELEADPDMVNDVYILNIYERQSDGNDVIIESYKISFNENAKDINGESIFVEFILEQYSKILRAKVGTDGFNLLERVFDDEQSPVVAEYVDTYSTSDATTLIDTTAIVDATRVVDVEVPDGNAWTTTSSLTQAKSGLSGCGDVINALCFGGDDGGRVDTTEIWNGSTWATTTTLNVARYSFAGCGDTGDALCFGGSTGFRVDTTEIWNGSSWATTTSLTEAKNSLAGCGNVNDALCFGGYSNIRVDTTEIWNGSTWATTSNLSKGNRRLSGCGNVSDALCFGGDTLVATDTTEIWNGSTWATTTTLNVARYSLAGCGNISNALCFGGYTDARVDTTEIWNGSSWATTGSLTGVKSDLAGCGNDIDALCFGGYIYTATTEIWYTTYATVQQVEHYDEIIPQQIVEHYTVTTGVREAKITNDGQDFSQWETDPDDSPLSRHPYAVITEDPWHNKLWGYIGLSNGSTNQTANVYLDKLLTESGWNGIFDDLDQSDPNEISYAIKKSNEDLTSLFSVQPLKKGTEGSLVVKGTFDTSVADQILAQGYAGVIDADVFDTEKIYYNLVYDAGYSKNVKDQIVGLAQAREDCVAIVDNGDNATFNDAIYDRQNNYVYNTYFASLFDSNSRIYDIFTSRQVWFSPSYHMAYILPRNDRIAELWYAAAGNNRGVARDIQELRYNLTPGQREQFYINQINPIIKFNTSYMLYSQLTTQSKPSALQDLNIVRLFLYLKKALDQYANTFIFNQNNQITWNQVKSEVVNFLEQVKKKRGIFNYSVDVGATNLERKNKSFHINVIFSPVKTTEKIELNFYIR